MNTALHPAGTVLLAALDSNKVTPGILGFIVFAALGAGTWWLLKAMNRSLRRVDFVEAPESGEPAATETVADGGVDAKP